MIGLKKSLGFDSGGTMVMDQSSRQSFESDAAMRDYGFDAIQLLLSAADGEFRRSGFDESDRRTVHEDAVLRVEEDGRFSGTSGTLCESETSDPVDAFDGDSRDLSWPQHELAADGSCDLPVPSSWSSHRASESGLEHGYHVYPAIPWVCLSGGNHGLVFAIRSGLEAVEQSGDSFLCRSSQRCFSAWGSGDIQHGSGMSVHKSGFYSATSRKRHPDQYGLEGKGLRQHLQRAALEEREIRRRLSQGVSGDDGGSGGTWEILSVLQSREISSGAGIPDTGVDLLWKGKRSEMRQRLKKAFRVGLQSTISRTNDREDGVFWPGHRTDELSTATSSSILKKEKRSKKERIKGGGEIGTFMRVPSLPSLEKQTNFTEIIV